MIALLGGCVRRVNSHYNYLNSSLLLNLTYGALDYLDSFQIRLPAYLNNFLTYAKILSW